LFTPAFRKDVMLKNTRYYANFCGAGVDNYPSYQTITLKELDGFIGLLYRNGLTPVPQFKFNFINPQTSFVWGDSRVQDVFPNGGYRRFAEIKSTLHLSFPIPNEHVPKNKPFYKVQPFLEHLKGNFMKVWDLGWSVSLDEIDIPFSGRCPLADIIKYKRAGDGFLFDSICEAGYLWTFMPRHQPCDPVQKIASPLHNRCLTLFKELPFDWHTVVCDNLFMSRRFCEWALEEKVMLYGVTRAVDRGVPDCVVQREVSTKSDLEKAKGTIKVARTTDNKILCASIYDNKPVHVMTTAHTEVGLLTKIRKVWDKENGSPVDFEFTRLNLIDSYNFNMNGVDIKDQLGQTYRVHGPWMRVQKWWWGIFNWGLDSVATNAYLIHLRKCEAAKAQPMTHATFQAILAAQFCGYPPSPLANTTPQLSSAASQFRASVGSSGTPRSQPLIAPKDPKVFRLTEKTVREHSFRFTNSAHAMCDVGNRVPCQWCYFQLSVQFQKGTAGNKRKRSEAGGCRTVGRARDAANVRIGTDVPYATVMCRTCAIKLCGAKCWNDWHGV
jgi:hypothetical protein